MSEFTGLTTLQENTIYDWLASVLPTDFLIVWGYPDDEDVVKEKPYCVLSVTSRPRPESAPALKYKNTDTFSYIFDEVFSLSIKFFSNADIDYRQTVIRSQYFNHVKERFKANGLACRQNLGEYNAILALSQHFELRVGVDFEFARCVSSDEVIPQMDKIEIEGTFTHEDDSETIKDIIINTVDGD